MQAVGSAAQRSAVQGAGHAHGGLKVHLCGRQRHDKVDVGERVCGEPEGEAHADADTGSVH